MEGGKRGAEKPENGKVAAIVANPTAADRCRSSPVEVELRTARRIGTADRSNDTNRKKIMPSIKSIAVIAVIAIVATFAFNKWIAPKIGA